jgi:PAS domain S-box-containing protein
MEASGTGLWEWNVGTGAVTWSAECYRIFGLTPYDFDGTAAGFGRLLFPGDRERVWAAVRGAVDQRTRYEAEFRIVRPDGEVRWVCNIGRAVYSGHEPPRMLGTITDITRRKASEAALLESRQRLAATQTHAPSASSS